MGVMVSGSQTGVRPRSRDADRRLGAFYTPLDVARVLASWAIRSPSDVVLDPSFGGCAFFEAAIAVLRDRGCDDPARHIYGADIDPERRNYLQPFCSSGAIQEQFLTADFLSTDPAAFGGARFDVVLGNPPYVRHHWVPKKFELQRLVGDGLAISARANYWVYFVVHACRFLRKGGRMALVLPGSLLTADYAAPVRRLLRSHFSEVLLVLLRDRLFEGVQETSVVLLAAGFGTCGDDVRLCTADHVAALAYACRSWRGIGRPVGPGCGSWGGAALDSKALDLYSRIRSDSGLTALRNVAKVKIGTVTGCNSFFVLSADRARELDLPGQVLRPIVSRASYVRGLTFRAVDFSALIGNGAAAYLFVADAEEKIPARIKRYIETAEAEGISTRYKCVRREPWWQLDEPEIPDAFLHYMAGTAPHLVLNKAHCSCTNAIHQVLFASSCSESYRASAALFSTTSLFQLAAEVVGRSYGGGVLKVEPSSALDLPVPRDGSFRVEERTMSEVDLLLRQGRPKDATLAADRAALVGWLGLSEADVLRLREARQFLAEMRIPGRPAEARHVRFRESGRLA